MCLDEPTTNVGQMDLIRGGSASPLLSVISPLSPQCVYDCCRYGPISSVLIVDLFLVYS
jgi:hypothetical protein